MVSKYLMSMALLGLLLPACGEESKTPSGGSDNGGNEGNEGEGSPNEGEGVRPPGADGEPCGGSSSNTCLDGLECGAKEPGICTCPQWFQGIWSIEISNLQTFGYQFDPANNTMAARNFWLTPETALNQDGCNLWGNVGGDGPLWGDLRRDGRIDPPPLGFRYVSDVPYGESKHWITFTGILSLDHQTISGTCEGEFGDGTVDPIVFFRVQCDFVLTQQ